MTPDPAAWLTASGLPENILAGSTLRAGGSSEGVWTANNMGLHVGDDEAAVLANRAALQAQLGADAIQWLNQVHGVGVIAATPRAAAQAPRADAMWTTARGLALAIMTADCVPVLMADRSGEVIGAAHAGWQGLRGGVLFELIAAMPVAAAALTAWIGPAISGPNYEVGADVWASFASRDPDALAAHPSQPDKRQLDLTAVALRQLTSAGVREVSTCGLCTYADERLYSHRQAQHTGAASTGRFASVIMRS